MPRSFAYSVIAVFFVVIFGAPACAAQSPADEEAADDTDDGAVADALAGLEKRAGFLDLYIDPKGARVVALLPAPDAAGVSLRAIHAARLTAGLGSNPIGLDRGWGDAGKIVRFRRMGARVFAEVENHRYRASADNAAEKRAVDQSFADSVIWSGAIEAEGADGRLVVDLSTLLTADVLGLAQRLDEGGAGFSRDPDRSAPEAASALVFPDNVEIDATLTFASAKPGPQVRATAAAPTAVTLRVHHTFARLPAPGYRPRLADPRVGVLSLGVYDYSAPLAREVPRALAIRHRLQRKDPADPQSPAAEPIVFYVDPGAPAAIRDALVEGASWWADAFKAAGWPDGFRVEILPEDAHPLDIRYNVIQWVHRQTRGWSYGGGIIDPRTGEMIKGHVILGSQRVRQDRMIFEGLAGAGNSGSGRADDPVELSLARIRQLSAHEVAHALGFGHNFAASINDRASVADYPAPHVVATPEGGLDFSNAYAAGIGRWDVVTVKWLYGDYPPETEREDLDRVVKEAREAGLLFIADQHGRGLGEAHAYASVWDNGADPVAELENVLAVRRIALDAFDVDRLAPGRPVAALRRVFAPVYLYHRYQLAAAAKFVGGLTFSYGKAGADAPAVAVVPAADQRRALDVILGALSPDALDVSERVLALMEPETDTNFFHAQPREALAERAGAAFDLFAAAETASDLVFAALLHPARAERLVQFKARDPDALGLEEVLIAADAAVFARSGGGLRAAAINRAVQARYVAALLALHDGARSHGVRAAARAHLAMLRERFGGGLIGRGFSGPDAAAGRAELYAQIDNALSRPAPPIAPTLNGPDAPPGSPIGATLSIAEDCWHCD
ncbi:MAG: zinc-dependent metalloprotease [Pseudomonadota bacterium]